MISLLGGPDITTADDLAGSIIDGRLADQTARLMRSGYNYVFLIVEGDLSSTSLPHETLLGACIYAELRPASHLIRTACIEDNVLVIKQLVEQGQKVLDQLELEHVSEEVQF